MICDWSVGVPRSLLPEAGGGAILGPTVFDVTDLYGESGQSCMEIIEHCFVYGNNSTLMPFR